MGLPGCVFPGCVLPGYGIPGCVIPGCVLAPRDEVKDDGQIAEIKGGFQ